MKNIKRHIIIIVTILICFLFSMEIDAQWFWQNPLPQGNWVTSSTFIDSTTGWAAGYGGTIIYTKDGGLTWESQDSGVSSRLLSICFIDSSYGWAVGYNSPIIHTTNGGESWYSQDNGMIYSQINKVFFINDSVGFVAGTLGLLKKTTNSGENWSNIIIDTFSDITSIYFINSQIGWLKAQGLIFLTFDGGENWIKNSANIGSTLFFVNENIGWSAGGYNGIYKTTNGGITWEKQNDGVEGSPIRINDVSFIDTNTGWICGDNGVICHTTNGGVTWKQQNYMLGNNLETIFALSGNNCVAAGRYGKIYRTFNSGSSWIESIGNTGNLKSISIIDENNIWCAGKYLLHTVDGGQNWKIDSTNLGSYNSIFFENDKMGWCGGDDKFIQTIDGGNTWKNIELGELTGIRSIFFKNEMNGWAIYDNGILKTTNGVDWDVINIGSYLNKLFFINDSIGWVVGRDGKILKTTNGGNTWIPKLSGVSGILADLFFLNENIGFCVGSESIKTTDGGESWIKFDPGTTQWLGAIFFTDNKIGYIVGDQGLIFFTKDGGVNWEKYMSVGTPEYQTLNDIKFVNHKIGWIVGDEGIILKTINGFELTTSINENKKNFLPNTFNVYQNYPNPFNPSTKIIYEIFEPTYVKISIYNICGQLVKELVNEYKNSGRYSVIWNGKDNLGHPISTGTYYYQIKSGNFIQTKKMMLLK